MKIHQQVLQLQSLLLLYSSSWTNSAVISDTEYPRLEFLHREFYAYGYFPPERLFETASSIGPPDGFGYGLGGMEGAVYDGDEKIIYAISEQGFVTLIDYAKGPMEAPQLPIKILERVEQDDGSFRPVALSDAIICSGLVFVSAVTTDQVLIYSSSKRTDAGDGTSTFSQPQLLHRIDVGVGPDHLVANADCSMVAVANEGEAYYDEVMGLINPEGSISILHGPFDDSSQAVRVDHVSLDVWTDDELIAKGVHLPVSEKALEYWDDYSDIRDDINFTMARMNYTSAMVLEPEWMQWNPAKPTELLVSLQENSAMVIVDTETATATDIFAYGLKCWDETLIDVQEDGVCDFHVIPGLCSNRAPDSFEVLYIDGKVFILLGNEGDDVEYGEFAERLRGKDIFDGNEIKLVNVTADPGIFNPDDPFGPSSTSRYFNDGCKEELAGHPEWCNDGMRFTIGSTMINYSNPQAPHIQNMVSIGGRGLTMYELKTDSLDLIWDSLDDFEVQGCKYFPWSHNGIQDAEFAPLDGRLYQVALALGDTKQVEDIDEKNDIEEDGCATGGGEETCPTGCACPMGMTIDERSEKNGPAIETVVTGTACDLLWAMAVSEKQSIAYLYQIPMDDPTNPNLHQVFHLSEASEFKNPGVAYNDRTMGDINVESAVFLSREVSPTGKDAIVIAGAHSTTLSYWEFICDAADEPVDQPGDNVDGGGGGDAPSVASSTTVAVALSMMMLVPAWLLQ